MPVTKKFFKKEPKVPAKLRKASKQIVEDADLNTAHDLFTGTSGKKFTFEDGYQDASRVNAGKDLLFGAIGSQGQKKVLQKTGYDKKISKVKATGRVLYEVKTCKPKKKHCRRSLLNPKKTPETKKKKKFLNLYVSLRTYWLNRVLVLIFDFRKGVKPSSLSKDSL